LRSDLIFDMNSIKETFVDFETPGPGWCHVGGGPAKFQFAGAVTGHDKRQLLDMLMAIEPNIKEIRLLINSFDGHFGIVYQDDVKTIAVTDCISSFPIFYKETNEAYSLATASKVFEGNREIDTSQAKALMLSGYTVGNKTIYQNLSVLEHGQVYFQTADKPPVISRYFQFTPWVAPFDLSHDELKRQLVDVTLKVISRVIDQASNQIIAVPLSAGLDSRLIVSALRHLGAKNVLCYSYGPKGNFESKIAKLIADKLGYKWVFVETTPAIQRKFWASGVPADFIEQSNDCLAGPVFHDLFVTQTLLDRGLITSDSVMVNGNSGDFITGNHIPMALAESNEICADTNAVRLVDVMLKKHYSMWKELSCAPNLDPVRTLLLEQLKTVDAMGGTKSLSSLHEYLEMTNRQIKWVIKRQKIYDYYGVGWALPLWDRDFMRFWERVPLQFKTKQNLYIDVLREQNWGGVWKDIPGNSARHVSPAWLRYIIRPLFKAMCLPLGKVAWHRFEKRFLDYWMDELGLYGPYGYKSVLLEEDTPRNCLAFHIRDYAYKMGCQIAIFDPKNNA